MGVAGAAISTTVSRMVYAVLGLWLAHNKELPAHFENLMKFKLDMDVIRRVFKMGITNGLEGSLFHIGKISISSLVSSFGTVLIAANSVASTLNNVGWTIVGGFPTVMLSVVGQCIGAGEKEQAKLYTKKLLRAATVASYVLFAIIFLLRYQMVRLFDFDEETLKVCGYYTGVLALIAMASFYPYAFGPMQAFRAAGDIKYTTILGLSSMFGFRVGLCYVLNWIFPQLGLMCVCFGMWADYLFRMIMNVIHLRRGKWLDKQLV